MPKSTLTWYKSKAKRILNDIRCVKHTALATALNESPQVISYRLKNVYPEVFEDVIRLLDLAGYEIKEKEEVI